MVTIISTMLHDYIISTPSVWTLFCLMRASVLDPMIQMHNVFVTHIFTLFTQYY